jgi:hypothetical protein
MIERRGLLVGAAGFAWVGGLVGASALAQDDRTKLRDTLLELEIGSWQFFKDKNTEAMKGFLADEAVLIFSDGSRYTKTEFLKLMPDFRLDSFTVDAKSAELLVASPDVAALLYRITYTTAAKGAKPDTVTVSASDTYVRRSGKWLSLFYQETQVRG